MNVTPSMIYWISAFDNIRDVALPIFVIGMIIGILTTLLYVVRRSSKMKTIAPRPRRAC